MCPWEKSLLYVFVPSEITFSQQQNVFFILFLDNSFNQYTLHKVNSCLYSLKKVFSIGAWPTLKRRLAFLSYYTQQIWAFNALFIMVILDTRLVWRTEAQSYHCLKPINIMLFDEEDSDLTFKKSFGKNLWKSFFIKTSILSLCLNFYTLTKWALSCKNFYCFTLL